MKAAVQWRRGLQREREGAVIAADRASAVVAKGRSGQTNAARAVRHGCGQQAGDRQALVVAQQTFFAYASHQASGHTGQRMPTTKLDVLGVKGEEKLIKE